MNSGFDFNDKRWRSGVFRPSRRKLFLIFFTAAFMGYVGVVVLIERQDFYEPPLRVESLFGLLPVLSLLAFLWLAVAGFRAWRFRGSCFTMDSMPGVIGGKFCGQLSIPNLFERDTKIRVEIVNEKEVRRRGGRNNGSIRTERYYFDYTNFRLSDCRLDGRFIRIPVEFTIPYKTKDETDNGKESSKRGDVKVRYRWLLKAKAVIGGADLNVAFVVPIYKTAESDPEVIEKTKDHQELTQEMATDGGPKRIELLHRAGHKRYAARAWPGFGTIVTPLVAGLMSIGGGIWLMCAGISGLYQNASGTAESIIVKAGGIALIGFSLPFLGVGLLLLIILMQLLSRKETWVDFGYLHHKGKFLFYSWKKKIALGRIQDVVFEKSGSGEDVEIYRVVVKHKVDLPKFATNLSMADKSLYIADGITSKAEAMWLKEELLAAVIGKV